MRTIICLAHKRSGTTAMHHVFAQHPQVRIAHPNQDVTNWEPNFWHFGRVLTEEAHTLSEERVAYYTEQFTRKLGIMLPGAAITLPPRREQLFAWWGAIVERYGPVVFEKSPHNMYASATLDLIWAYRQAGHDVRLFALVRDPRDVLTSQHVKLGGDSTLLEREAKWARDHATLADFRARVGEEHVPVFRYEDLCNAPEQGFGRLFAHCGLDHAPQAYAHIRPVGMGAYLRSEDPAIRAWQPSEALRQEAQRWGYDLSQPPDLPPQPGLLARLGARLRGLFGG